MAGANDAKSIHLNLLTDISDEMDPNSTEYENFTEHMKKHVPKGVLGRNPTLLKKLQAMASRGYLGIGKYDLIKMIAKDSKNIDVLELIEEAERKIAIIGPARVEGGSAPGEISSTSGIQETVKSGTTQSDVQSADVQSSKRKREEDDSDILYTRDNQGLGFYDTKGKKGYLLILNSVENRKGTDKDVKLLNEFFGDVLKFDIDDPRAYENSDLTTAQLDSCLEGARNILNGGLSKKYYCFICVILSHGDEGGIKTKDGWKSTEDIRRGFNNKNMDNFAGKPKVFLIQACRGTDVHDSVTVDDEADDTNQTENETDQDESDVTINIPTDADTLMAYSTTPGYRSFRRTQGAVVGSWFIIECMKEFQKSWKKHHVEDMLITVREKVALDWSKMDGGKQMPCAWSTMTKRLRLS